MNWSYLVLPVIAGLIGWFTNFIAVKMLFHPKEPVNLGLFKLQGIFPKRQKDLGKKIGDLVANQLFSINDIKDKFNTPETRLSITSVIDERVDVFLRTKLTVEMPMLAFVMNDALVEKIKGTLMAEINDMLPDVLDNFADKVSEKIDIEEIVKSKVEAFSSDKLEDVLNSILKKEFRFIEVIGAVLGFLIGVLQVFLVQYM